MNLLSGEVAGVVVGGGSVVGDGSVVGGAKVHQRP